MNRLLVNPGTPQAWEIQLKPGANTFGRSEANDFQINDPSVSSSHCQIVVTGDAVVLQDSGSTNGTFVGGRRIQEGNLENGKDIKLGSVAMIFYAEAIPQAATVASVAAAPAVRVAMRAVPVPVPVPVSVRVAAPEEDEGTTVSAPALFSGARFCKYHPQVQARYLCQKCDRTYCELCVQMPEGGSNYAPTCRTCGTEVVPFQFARPAEKSFYAKLPGAFGYPFQGAGIIILICATIVFAGMKFISGSIFGLITKAALYGFVFLFMQNIILMTTSDEKDTLSFPEASGLFGAFFQLVGTVVASFWLAIGLTVARFSNVAVPSEAIIASVILGGIYFPMALLVVAMKDSVLAANPLIVIPSMVKVPLKYSVTVIMLLAVFGIRQLGDMISGGAGSVMLRTHDMNTLFQVMAFQVVWALLSVYLLTVTMRLLGLFYNSSKRQLGWFSS